MPSIQKATMDTLSTHLFENFRRSNLSSLDNPIDIPLGIGPDDEVCPVFRKGFGDPTNQTALTNARPREFETDDESRFTVDQIQGNPGNPGIGYIEYIVGNSEDITTVNPGKVPLVQSEITLFFFIFVPFRSAETLRPLYAESLSSIFYYKRFGVSVWDGIWPGGNSNQIGINTLDQIPGIPLEPEVLEPKPNSSFEPSLMSVKFTRRYWAIPAT